MPAGVTRLEYERYISSEHWTARKRAFWARHPKVCRGCESTDDVQLHHGTYERMGRELDSDLFPVCQTCHTLIHDLYKIKQGKMELMQATIITLASVQKWKAEPAGPREPARFGRNNPLDKTLAHIRMRRGALLRKQGLGGPIK